MNVTLHIENLILDGIDVPHHQRPLLQAALEAELGRLLAGGGLAPDMLSGGAMPGVPGGSVQLAGTHEPGQLGAQIARAVYGGIGK